MLVPFMNTDDLGFEDVPTLSEFIKATDQARAVARPTDVAHFYVELEYAEAEEEQRRKFAEEGELETRPFDVKASETREDAEKARKFSNDADAEAAATRENEKAARQVLGPHERRPTDSKVMKYGRWATLLVGDIAAFSGAALILGEEVPNAALQALSVGGAIVTLGAVGREVRYSFAARARRKEPEEITDDEKTYKAFFTGGHEGERLLKIILGACAAGCMLVGVGVLSLRAQTEGMGAGLVFGLIAIALGLASFYNSFDTADDIAEHLDIKASQTKKAEKKARKAREAPIIKEHDAAGEEAQAVRRAKQAAGEAAAAAIRRRLYGVLNTSSGVAGDGVGEDFRPWDKVRATEELDEERIAAIAKDAFKDEVAKATVTPVDAPIAAREAADTGSLNGDHGSQGAMTDAAPAPYGPLAAGSTA